MVFTLEAVLESSRGNDCIIARQEGSRGGYKYTKIKPLSNGLVRYRCTNRKCKANLFLDHLRNVVHSSNFPHNHPEIEPDEIQFLKLHSHCKKSIRDDQNLNPLSLLIEQLHGMGNLRIPDSRVRLLLKAMKTVQKKGSSSANRTKKKKDNSTPCIMISDESSGGSCDEGEMSDASEKKCTIGSDSIIFAEPSFDPTIHTPATEVGSRQENKKSPVDNSPDCGLIISEVFTATDKDFKQEQVDLNAEGEEIQGPTVKVESPQEKDLFNGKGLEVKKETSCQETQTETETDEDMKFFHFVLPKIKKLKPSDKSMLRAQILQLIKWKTNEDV